MNYYKDIKNELLNNEVCKKVKNYAINRSDLQTYYNVGKLLSKAGKHYGQGIIKEYSKRLTNDLNKSYNVRTLYNMRLYYEKICCNEKLQPVAAILSWSHYCELLRINDINEIIYYINICSKHNLSKRELVNRIKNNEYVRIDNKTKMKLMTEEKFKVDDFIKNPIIVNNKNNYTEISEKILQKLILEDIESFMKELGNSFCFISSEYKIKIGNVYNYIDLLLFNYEFDCFVVVELNVTELKKEHIGQIQVYMNYVDNNLKKINQDKTIGIIICKKDNKFIMGYCSDKRILAKEYELL